ncbi:MAG: polymer-forming cytoskeletal protein [Paludibacteraceae bacterium]|nr:polymer-forming cytoskeletal protein [Paludibacteraceae bacterium]
MAKDVTPTSTTTYSSGVQNTIASGTKIVGTISTESEFRLDGEVNGDITSQSKVIIGQTGIVKGNIFCATAEIYGVVVGNITTSGLLSLRSTANVKGDINIKTLSIEPDARFEGSCSMNKG